MQDTSNQSVSCRTCGASRGAPCTGRGGRELDRVHWGRPHYSERRTWTPAVKKAPYVRPTPDPDEVSEYESRRYKD